MNTNIVIIGSSNLSENTPDKFLIYLLIQTGFKIKVLFIYKRRRKD